MSKQICVLLRRSVALSIKRLASNVSRVVACVARAAEARTRATTLTGSLFLLLALLWNGFAKADHVTIPTTIFPADRQTHWDPGIPGGIPNRTVICATIDASTYGNGTLEASAGIQAAIDACSTGAVVQLSAGEFLLNNRVTLNKGVTLRGAGPSLTTLKKTNGAIVGQNAAIEAEPVVVIGPNRWPSPNGAVKNLAADGVKGTTTILVTDTIGLTVGDVVILDELSGAAFRPSRLSWAAEVYASADYLVTWRRHNPTLQYIDDPVPGAAQGWFSRFDRPRAEAKEIVALTSNTVTFSSVLHATYRQSLTAQIAGFSTSNKHVRNAGLEDLRVTGGGDHNINIAAAAYCWVKNVESDRWLGRGINVANSYRVELRQVYVHDAAWPSPGGGAYAVSLQNGTAEVLLEDSILVRSNKVIVGNAGGAGSVIGYNYFDQAFIFYNPAWVEVHVNASHMVGPHHWLFEGNYAPNYDSDFTHGNSVEQTAFRNWFSGFRTPFTSAMGDAIPEGNGPHRAIGAQAYSDRHTFVGNVLGTAGRMAGWIYNSTGPAGMTRPAIWLLGWESSSPQPYDSQVEPTTIRHGNWDYLTNSVVWDPAITDHNLPASLYLSSKPAFFGTNPWPWVDATGPATGKLCILPARQRFYELQGLPAPECDPEFAGGGSGDPTAPTRIGVLGSLTNRENIGSAPITVPNDATMIIVGVMGKDDDLSNYFTGGSVRLGGQAMTAVAADGNAAKFMGALFYLVNPPTGSQTLDWDWLGDSSKSLSFGGRFVYGFYKGVDTASPVRSSSGVQQNTNPHQTGTLAALSGDLIVAWAGSFAPGEELTFTWANATEVSEFTAFNSGDGAWAESSPTAAQTVSADGSVSTEGAIVAIVIK